MIKVLTFLVVLTILGVAGIYAGGFVFVMLNASSTAANLVAVPFGLASLVILIELLTRTINALWPFKESR